MQLTIFGANGPTGRLLTAQALDEGHDVVAFTRHPEDFPLDGRSSGVAAGDVHDADAVGGAVDGVRRGHLHARGAVHQAARRRLLRRHGQHRRTPCTGRASNGSSP